MANRFFEKFNQGLETGTKIWEADAKRRMQQELMEANKMAPEERTLGLTAPQPGQVPVGYENFIQARPEGGFMPTAGEGLTPEQMQQRQVIAERFSAPTAFEGARTSYSLGGVTRDTAFTPEEVAQAKVQRKADIYSSAGREDLADQLQTNALARQASSLNIKDLQRKNKREDEFEVGRQEFSKVAESAIGTMEAIRNAQANGDVDAAAQAAVNWRNSLAGPEMLRYDPRTKTFEASKDAGKTWKTSSSGVADVTNPKFFENLYNGINQSVDERGAKLLKTGANREEFAKVIGMEKDEAFRKWQMGTKEREFNNVDRAYNEGVRQFNQGLISAKELENLKTARAFKLQELDNQGKLAAARETANSKVYPNTFVPQGLTKSGVPVLLDTRTGQYKTGGGQLLSDTELQGLQVNAKVSGEKALTPKDAETIQGIIMDRDPTFMKQPKAVQDELISREWKRIQNLNAGGGEGSWTPDYTGLASKDRLLGMPQ